jgi:hypothetical protein
VTRFVPKRLLLLPLLSIVFSVTVFAIIQAPGRLLDDGAKAT